MSLPRHVAIIMDRNGEWAKKRSLTRIMGHTEGVRTVKRVVNAAGDAGIQVLSLFAFSTENWLRPQDEVSFLMKLLEEFIKKEARELISNGVKLIVSGRLDRIPVNVRKAVEKVIGESAENGKLILNIALDYGGRDEITRATRKIAEKVLSGKIEISDINEILFFENLDNRLPEIDLLIRTGGEQRISNFMLWQAAYAELYFTPVLWPDFSADDLNKALAEFSGRKRRFGMTDEQI